MKRKIKGSAITILAMSAVVGLSGAFMHRDLLLQREILASTSVPSEQIDFNFINLQRTANSDQSIFFLKLLEGQDPLVILKHCETWVRSPLGSREEQSLLAICSLLRARSANSAIDKMAFVHEAIASSNAAVSKDPNQLFARAARIFIHKKLPASFSEERLVLEDSRWLDQALNRKLNK